MIFTTYEPIKQLTDLIGMTCEILVVDDNRDYQFIFFKILKELDEPYVVKFVDNARACCHYLDALRVRHETSMPSLIIIDLNMPGLNGLQLLKKLKDHTSGNGATGIPVVIMSNGIKDHQISQCYQAGANAVIIKPTDFHDLKITIQSICRFWIDRGTNYPRL